MPAPQRPPAPPRPRPLTIAACAPASYGFVAEADVPATERAIQGRARGAAAYAAHVARMLDHHARILERAAGAGAGLAVVPEDTCRLANLIARHRRQPWCAGVVEDAYAATVARFGAIAQAGGLFVAAGTMTHRAGRFYNTAILLDPAGRVIASYDKTHLPPGEAKALTPGDALPVFDTPLGRVGFLICWDIVFPEAYGALALQGAELVIQPTFGHADEAADITARARAADWAVPLVISMWGGSAGIIDAAGNYLARTGRVGDSLALAPLPLGAPRPWLFMSDVRRDLPQMRRPELYRSEPPHPAPTRSRR